MAFWTISTFSSSVGAILTAASVIISASGCPGTSMIKQWLMRRAVRIPVSRATTAPISSSVCRLPFIRACASPLRTSSTAFAAEIMTMERIDDFLSPEMSIPFFAALRRGSVRQGRPESAR